MLDIFNDLSLLKTLTCNTVTGASDKTEVVHDEPDLKLYWAKKYQDIELEKCPTYGEKMANQKKKNEC